MNYKWVRDHALSLIDRYSTAGDPIAPSYNNQADYLRRIPDLVDDAQIHLATTTARIRALVPLSAMSGDVNGSWLVCTLPRDCWQLSSAGLISFEGGKLTRLHRYHPLGPRRFALPLPVEGEVYAEYFRYPRLMGDAPADTDVLDNTVEAQRAIPYYVAACLVMQDDPYVCQTLMNEFESRLARLAELPHTELYTVEDDYAMEGLE